MLQLVLDDADEFEAEAQKFYDLLFTEENDIVYRENLDILRVIYDAYRQQNFWPGRQGNLSMTSFVQLLEDASAFDEQFTRKEAGLCFVAGNEPNIDEISGYGHLEMSFVEYLVALGHVVYMRDNFDPVLYAELLEDFFQENIFGLYSTVSSSLFVTNKDDPLAAYRPILNFIAEIFEAADLDQSGTLSTWEFMRYFKEPKVQKKCKQLGLRVSDMKLVFKRCDTDGSGDVSVQELQDGFIQMKTATKGLERILAFLEQTFASADLDGGGTLDKQEFEVAFSEASVVKKLNRMGVDSEEINELFEEIDADGSGEVTQEEVLEGFIEMRNPVNQGPRLLNFMEKAFIEFDDDNSGTLSKHEMKRFVSQDTVAAKLKRFRDFPPADEVFTDLDKEGKGSVTWSEFRDGLKRYL
jgi:Ca2+-binding EF-hand superfamily protein